MKAHCRRHGTFQSFCSDCNRAHNAAQRQHGYSYEYDTSLTDMINSVDWDGDGIAGGVGGIGFDPTPFGD